MSIIPFPSRATGDTELKADPEDRLLVAWPQAGGVVAGVEDDEADGDPDRHWGVAMALASWPLCLGASAVLAVI